MKKQSFRIDFYGCWLDVECIVTPPIAGSYDTPPDDGEIELTGIFCEQKDISLLVEHIDNYEELIIEQINKQL